MILGRNNMTDTRMTHGTWTEPRADRLRSTDGFHGLAGIESDASFFGFGPKEQCIALSASDEEPQDPDG